MTASQIEITQDRLTAVLRRMDSFTSKACNPPQLPLHPEYSGRVRGQIRAMYLRAARAAATDVLSLLTDLQSAHE